MKNVIFNHTNSGLNSNRLILNRVIDIVESKEPSGIVEISHEMSLDDVESLINNGLTYKVNSGIMTSFSFKTKVREEFLQAFIG